MTEEYKLTIEIKNTKPVELVDLTDSLLSLADEYKRFLVFQQGPILAEEVKLYVKEIKTGSIVTDIIAIAPGLLPFAQYAMTLIDFSDYIKKVVKFFLGEEEQDPKIDKRSYENLSRFLEPVAKDHASQLNCHTTINGNVSLVVNVKSYSVKIRLDYYFEAVKSLRLGARLFAAKLIFCPILSDLTTFLSAEGREEVAI